MPLARQLLAASVALLCLSTSSAFAAVDETGPRGGVNRNSPVDTLMTLIVYAHDDGVGLERADLLVDGALVTSGDFGLCPDPATGLCPGSGSVTITHDTSKLANGAHHRTVRVYDAVGNATDLVDEDFEVFHPEPPVSVRTLSIGSGGLQSTEPQPQPPGTGTPGGTGGVAGTRAAACRKPRLSVSLSSKPLRVSRGVPVLRHGRRYTFTGRLSCVIAGVRKSAPKRTRVELLNRVGKRTVTKPAVRIADKGRLRAQLSYPVGTRTLIFRYRNADGTRTQVSIKIRTERVKAKKR